MKYQFRLRRSLYMLSPLAMAEWIEITCRIAHNAAWTSPLAMAEWIEILSQEEAFKPAGVSASDGGVD